MTAVYGTFTTTSYTSRTNTSITAPTPITNGDILLIVHITAGSGTAVTQTLPAGFTAIGTRQTGSDGSFGYSCVMGYKIAASESGADYVVTHAASNSQGLIIRVDGTNTLSVDAFSQNVSSSNGTTGTALSVTPTAADDLLLYFALNWNANAISPPTGMTEVLDSNLPYFAWQALASGAATGNKTQTFTSPVPWFCNLVAIKDSSGAATVTGAQTTLAAATTGTIARLSAVTGAQTTQACSTAGTISIAALPAAANVDGAQTTLACTTTGTIGDVLPPQPVEPTAPGGPSRAAQRRLKQAVENRSRFEAERARRLANLTMDRPLFVTPPETLEMINETLVEAIDHSVLFENEDQDEELLSLLMMI